ncbi:hypothetical protein DYBT9623_04576 [Dyadobacter sp. CECT 9623]|uniref:Activator of Hsp90 ATPase homologue 1/2-like C-terminal domain-containing protein n=1 Tax=Dyadobacter linearis TaxID=2823330 RepID=A0ABN7RCS6_9BACT|nr:SRPBCC domain-containing protein [Dyadobacter sp. CECT 9623]CAG5073050.1 hypothetical protein DYBT9623_04576 [Dyadobacter sp. CECT 9623]
MNEQLIVKQEILIEAPVSKVWEVLIAPKYIRQWDDLPQDFGDYYLEVGRVIEWTGSTRLTVTECEPHERLAMKLYAFKWELPPASYDIAYTYQLSIEYNGTRLSLQIGDFSALPEGKNYYDSSLEFAGAALEKIKSLAQNRM